MWLVVLAILCGRRVLNRRRALISAAVTLAFACVDTSLQFFSREYMPCGGSLKDGYYVWIAPYFVFVAALVVHAFTSADRGASSAAPA